MSLLPLNLLNIPLEIRHLMFHSLILTPHTITISLPSTSNSLSPISNLSLACSQLNAEITAWSASPPKQASQYLHPTTFGLISPSTTITFHLSLTRLDSTSPVTISKTPRNIEEAAVFQLWREIMVELGTCEMDKIDRKIRDRFEWFDGGVMRVLNGVYDDIVVEKGMEEVEIEGENRYWVITTWFWACNLCAGEGKGMLGA